MSLKGYQFFDKVGNVEATFRFKDLTLTFYKEVSRERVYEIVKYINDNGFNINCTEGVEYCEL